MPTQHKLSFPERIKLLKAAAEDLRELAQERRLGSFADIMQQCADAVMTEVIHMEAAQTRFAARKPFARKQMANS